MKPDFDPQQVQQIPLDRIQVLNPRDRNQRGFESIVESIRNVGLKKPIVVTARQATDGLPSYALVCGEGRLTAFRLLGETHIPALVIEVNDEEAYIMSLVENIARRQYRPLEILASIRQLAERGYSAAEIGRKRLPSSLSFSKASKSWGSPEITMTGFRWEFPGAADAQPPVA